jgi:hypothetical protein
MAARHLLASDEGRELALKLDERNHRNRRPYRPGIIMGW